MTDDDHPCCRRTLVPVIGIDEVGRGSLIGDVVTAAVVFTQPIPDGLRDSKKLSEKKRIAFDELIRENAEVAIGKAAVWEIDQIGILRATLLAMRRAWKGIPSSLRCNALVLVDGDQAPDIPAPMQLLPKGDDLCPTISAASIVAKVHRDREVTELHGEEPFYGWAKNKGYGTKDHIAAITQHGPSSHHRRSFAPIRGMIRE